ncbi:MAG: cobalamin-dependent protein [Anaerolineae bacterium]|nr:cobalamin-dependent protein [Anaerolineae bacterium]
MDPLLQTVSQIIFERHSALAEAIVARQYQEQGAFWERYGPAGRQKSLQDAGYHLTYLAEALAANDVTLFTDYIAWVRALFAGLGFPETALADTLRWMGAALQTILPPTTWPAVSAYLTAAQSELPPAAATPPTFLSGDSPLTQLGRQYLNALLAADRRTASRLILAAVEQGTSVREIYLHVFQPVQREIGRLWQLNQVSVAQEHFCTAATQMIMSQLYPYIFGTHKINRRLVATCVGGELHEIGMRMVADFLEMDGWDTYFMGANTPLESILRTVRERQADLLAVSATMTFHVPKVRELIAAVRAADGGRRLPIIVGGYPFNVAPAIFESVGADGTARDADEAVALADRLVAA